MQQCRHSRDGIGRHDEHLLLQKGGDGTQRRGERHVQVAVQVRRVDEVRQRARRRTADLSARSLMEGAAADVARAHHLGALTAVRHREAVLCLRGGGGASSGRDASSASSRTLLLLLRLAHALCLLALESRRGTMLDLSHELQNVRHDGVVAREQHRLLVQQHHDAVEALVPARLEVGDLERVRQRVNVGAVVEPHERALAALAHLAAERAHDGAPAGAVQHGARVARREEPEGGDVVGGRRVPQQPLQRRVEPRARRRVVLW